MASYKNIASLCSLMNKFLSFFPVHWLCRFPASELCNIDCLASKLTGGFQFSFCPTITISIEKNIKELLNIFQFSPSSLVLYHKPTIENILLIGFTLSSNSSLERFMAIDSQRSIAIIAAEVFVLSWPLLTRVSLFWRTNSVALMQRCKTPG